MQTAVDFLKSRPVSPETGQVYNVDPTRVFLMGYSLGAIGVLGHNQNHRSSSVAGHISVAGIKCGIQSFIDPTEVNAKAMPFLAVESFNDHYLRPEQGKRFKKDCEPHLLEGATSWSQVPKLLTNMQAATGHAHLIAYKNGGHRPFL